ncbi:MAG TPA: ABC transporter permease [Fimbriimonadaceae bacterium]|jgi:sodium transport system permease protein
MNVTLLIFKKELRDMFRDKRVRSMAFITPPLMIVMIMFLLGFLEMTVSKPTNQKIFFVKGAPSDIEASFRTAKWTVEEVNSPAEAEDLIRKGDAKVVIDCSSSSIDDEKGSPRAYFDPKQDLSKTILQQAQVIYNTAAIQSLMLKHNIPHSEELALNLKPKEVVIGGKSHASDFVVSLLPYLIVIWAFYGGMSIATELVAGEKEKNTLETLLISPATRTQIALGKFFSLCVVCLTSSLSSFIGLFIVEQSHTKIADTLFPQGLGLTLGSAALIVVVLIPTVAFFASLLLALSAYAKNPREAQTYLTAVSFLVLMPAMCSQFIGFTDYAKSSWLYAIPVLNTATIIRQALQSQLTFSSIAICIGVSIVLAVIGIKAAVTLFNKETVLVRV